MTYGCIAGTVYCVLRTAQCDRDTEKQPHMHRGVLRSLCVLGVCRGQGNFSWGGSARVCSLSTAGSLPKFDGPHAALFSFSPCVLTESSFYLLQTTTRGNIYFPLTTRTLSKVESKNRWFEKIAPKSTQQPGCRTGSQPGCITSPSFRLARTQTAFPSCAHQSFV